MDWALYKILPSSSQNRLGHVDNDSSLLEIAGFFEKLNRMPPEVAKTQDLPVIQLKLIDGYTEAEDFVYPIPGLSMAMRSDIREWIETTYPNVGMFGDLKIFGQNEQYCYWVLNEKRKIREPKDPERPTAIDSDFHYDSRLVVDIDITQYSPGQGFYVCSDRQPNSFYNTYHTKGWTGLTFKEMHRFSD